MSSAATISGMRSIRQIRAPQVHEPSLEILAPPCHRGAPQPKVSKEPIKVGARISSIQRCAITRSQHYFTMCMLIRRLRTPVSQCSERDMLPPQHFPTGFRGLRESRSDRGVQRGSWTCGVHEPKKKKILPLSRLGIGSRRKIKAVRRF